MCGVGGELVATADDDGDDTMWLECWLVLFVECMALVFGDGVEVDDVGDDDDWDEDVGIKL